MDKRKCQGKDALKTEEEQERESWWGRKSRAHKPHGPGTPMEGVEVLAELSGGGEVRERCGGRQGACCTRMGSPAGREP